MCVNYLLGVVTWCPLSRVKSSTFTSQAQWANQICHYDECLGQRCYGNLLLQLHLFRRLALIRIGFWVNGLCCVYTWAASAKISSYSMTTPSWTNVDVVPVN